MEPSVADHLRSKFLILVVADHDIRRLGAQLAHSVLVLIHELHLNGGQRPPDGSRTDMPLVLGGENGGSLREAVSLVDLYAEIREPL